MHQAGIFQQGAKHHIFLEFSYPEAPARLPGGDLLTNDGAQVIAFGKGLVAGLGALAAPPDTRDFAAVEGTTGFARSRHTARHVHLAPGRRAR